MFNMLSAKKNIIVCEGANLEDIGLRYRKNGELVHLRDEQGQRCKWCGSKDGFVWTDVVETHTRHKERCERKKLAAY